MTAPARVGGDSVESLGGGKRWADTTADQISLLTEYSVRTELAYRYVCCAEQAWRGEIRHDWSGSSESGCRLLVHICCIGPYHPRLGHRSDYAPQRRPFTAQAILSRTPPQQLLVTLPLRLRNGRSGKRRSVFDFSLTRPSLAASEGRGPPIQKTKTGGAPPRAPM